MMAYPGDAQDAVWIPDLWSQSLGDNDKVHHVCHNSIANHYREESLDLSFAPPLFLFLALDEVFILELELCLYPRCRTLKLCLMSAQSQPVAISYACTPLLGLSRL